MLYFLDLKYRNGNKTELGGLFMRKEIKAYVEAEVRDYHDTMRELADLREEILPGQPGEFAGCVNLSSQYEQAKKIRLITNKRLGSMERTVRSIGKVIAGLDDCRYQLLELKYWQKQKKLSDVGLSQELNVDRSTVYRWLDGIILAIAVEMGLIDDRKIKCVIKKMG